MKKLLLSLFVCSFVSLAAYDYEIQDLGVSIYSRSSGIDLNDKGQVLFYGSHRGYGNDEIVLWSPEKVDTFNKKSNDEDDDTEISIEKINNQGCGFGNADGCIQYIDENGEECKRWHYDWPIMWSPESGITFIKIFNSAPELIDINDHNQIVGTYGTEKNGQRIFIWENGEFQDLNIDHELISLGYHPLDYKVYSINNKGEILGYFSYGEKHPYKDVWRYSGEKYFFWDGHVTVIENHPDHQFFSSHLNDEGKVIFYGEPCYSSKPIFQWEKEKEVKKIESKNLPNSTRFQAISHDHSQIIYTGHYDEVYINDKIYDDWKELFDSSMYPGLDDIRIKKINNKGQILIEASFWGEGHVFLLSPIS